MNRENKWRGSEIRLNTEQWIFHLSENDLSEIDNALLQCNSGPDTFGQEYFPLSSLANKLEGIRQEVLNGLGFKLIKGLPAQSYSKDELVRIFWGIGLYLGDAVSQNAKGHLIGHVIDLDNDPLKPETRIYTTNYRQPYHTDSCDVVGLLCLHPAKEGGLSSIVSSTTIYHEIKRLRPDLLEILSQPFFVDRKGEIPKGKLPYYQLPIFHPSDMGVTTIYARDFIESAQRHSEVPKLTDQQIEALNLMDEMASSPELRLDMKLEAGDIQLCHNHTILHSRTSYIDFEEENKKRHLLRLWLSQADGRDLPSGFSERYGSIAKGERRGGIMVEGMKETIPFQPV